MNKKIIEDISRVSKAEKWPYPKIFKTFKEAGVTSYEVITAKHQTTYYLNGIESFQEQVPKGFKALEISNNYSIPMLKQALKNVQSGKTDYEEFLKEIAEAGAQQYRVDMSTNTVTYYGAKPTETYTETIPEFHHK